MIERPRQALNEPCKEPTVSALRVFCAFDAIIANVTGIEPGGQEIAFGVVGDGDIIDGIDGNEAILRTIASFEFRCDIAPYDFFSADFGVYSRNGIVLRETA